MTRVTTAILLCLLAGPAAAQPVSDGASFGGSFDDPSPPPASGGGAAAPASGDDFGGSFGGSSESPAQVPAATGGSGAAPASGDDFGGSFGGASGGTSGGGGGAATGGSSAAPAAGDDFGGSFGGSFGGADSPGGTAEAGSGAPAVGGSGFGGAFESGAGSGAGIAATPGGQMPDPVPDSPAPGVVVDPQIAAFEFRDYGIAPTGSLRQTQFHAATPTSVPGAQTLSTQALVTAMEERIEMAVIDVLGGDYSLPNAYVAPGLAEGGSLSDRIQQQAETWLRQVTGGQSDFAIVVYCSSPMCWLSYNGALRIVAAGYTNVYWYRGGIQAWEMAGLPTEPASF